MKTKTNDQTVERVCKYLDRKGIDWMVLDIQTRDQHDHEQALILNWNNVPDSLFRIMENHFDLYFDDEHTFCEGCSNLINTRPNGWGWQCNALMDDDGYLCLDCAEVDDVIETYVNNTEKAIPSILIDMIVEAGFSKHNQDSFENGLHRHMTDDPVKIAALLPDNVDYIFSLDNVSQFYVEFSVYTRPSS